MIRSYMNMDIIWIRLMRRLNMPIYLDEFFGKRGNVTLNDCQKVINIMKKSKKPKSIGIVPKDKVEAEINKGKDPAIGEVINRPESKDELKEFSKRVNVALSKTSMEVTWSGKRLVLYKH